MYKYSHQLLCEQKNNEYIYFKIRERNYNSNVKYPSERLEQNRLLNFPQFHFKVFENIATGKSI
jgi:hypothetical protein